MSHIISFMNLTKDNKQLVSEMFVYSRDFHKTWDRIKFERLVKIFEKNKENLSKLSPWLKKEIENCFKLLQEAKREGEGLTVEYQKAQKAFIDLMKYIMKTINAKGEIVSTRHIEKFLLLYDNALLKLWEKVKGRVVGGENLKKAEEIRKFMSKNGDVLAAIEIINLEDLKLKVIPPEIRCFNKLKRLYLGMNQIEDISSLAWLGELRDLWISSNKIKDISSLAGLRELRVLDLYSNQIEDISFLAGLGELRRLYLNDNKINNVILTYTL